MYTRKALFLAALVLISWGAISQHSPKALQVDPEQRTNGAFKQQKESKPNKPPAENKNQGDKEPSETYAFLGKALKIVDSFVAGFTFVIAIFTVGLFLDAKNKGRRELRAYLGATPQDINFISANLIQTYVHLANTGKTPARDVRQWTQWEIRDPGDNKTFPPPPEGYGRMPIVPGAKWSLGFEKTVTDAELQKIHSKEKVIFVWGRAEYVDIFGTPQWISFRYRNIGVVFRTEPDGKKVALGWALYAEPDGNDAS